MEKKYFNSYQLGDFVDKHDLRNRHSIIHFRAIVSIATANNKLINQQMDVMISFDNYDSLGKVTLMESYLDSNLYPTVFEANWQTMDHVDNEYLLISDTHQKNPLIGSYSVKIIPLKRLQE